MVCSLLPLMESPSTNFNCNGSSPCSSFITFLPSFLPPTYSTRLLCHRLVYHIQYALAIRVHVPNITPTTRTTNTPTAHTTPPHMSHITHLKPFQRLGILRNTKYTNDTTHERKKLLPLMILLLPLLGYNLRRTNIDKCPSHSRQHDGINNGSCK